MGDLLALRPFMPAREPALQSWGLVVGFVFSLSGVLRHVAEMPF